MMRNLTILIGAAATLAACGQSSMNNGASNAAGNSAATTPKPAAYCFFKDSETKDWKASVDKDGNVVVTGKAFREDSRYKAILSPATVSGTAADIAPTIAQNDTGFGAPDNWWNVGQTIPNSQAIATVNVQCGDKTIASLSVPRKK